MCQEPEQVQALHFKIEIGRITIPQGIETSVQTRLKERLKYKNFISNKDLQACGSRKGDQFCCEDWLKPLQY